MSGAAAAEDDPELGFAELGFGLASSSFFALGDAP